MNVQLTQEEIHTIANVIYSQMDENSFTLKEKIELKNIYQKFLEIEENILTTLRI